MMEEDPQILWRRIGAGDRRAFTALYRRHEDDVLRFCHALLRDPDDAREAANSTWAAVWRSRDAARRDVPLRPWLFRIAHNEAIDILRRRRPHEQLDTEIPALEDTAADAELHERFTTLRADLQRLTEPQRTALVLREMSGLGHEEIATVLDISTGAAKQTIYEARQALIDAEGGRTLSCELVRRDISAGDRRLLRSRRIRAHLLECAACQEFAEAVECQRRRFRALLPAPVGVALLTRLGGPASEVVIGGGGVGAGLGLPALGAKIGGPVATKVAAAALALVVGGGVASEAHRSVTHGSRPPAVAVGAALRTSGHADPQAGALPATGAEPAGNATRPAPRAPAALPAKSSASALGASAGEARAVADASVTSAPAGHAAQDAGLHASGQESEAVPPGQVKMDAPGGAAPSVPPGQAKKDAPGGAGSSVPPGQAKKDAPGGAAPSVPPGQAKRDAPGAAPSVPPGQAKKDAPGAGSSVPPGQAKKDAPGAAPSVPPGQAKTKAAVDAPAPPPSSPASTPDQAGQAPMPTAASNAEPAAKGPNHGRGGP